MNIHFGTCSWKYKDWQGILYPSGGTWNYLSEYARRLDTVEVDQWFWSLFGPDTVKFPDRDTVAEYVTATPPHFTFTVKVPNSITLTHFYNQRPGRGGGDKELRENPHFLSADAFRHFLDCLQPMHSRLGALMFQFEYLNRRKMSSQGEFVRRLDAFAEQLPPGFPYAVELRNPQYLNADWFGFLNRRKWSHVFVHGYYMPPFPGVFAGYGQYIRDFTVIRLMGEDRNGIEERAGNRWDKIIDNRDAELPAIVAAVRRLAEQGVKVFVNINNHYEGCAPLTIGKLQELLKAGAVTGQGVAE